MNSTILIIGIIAGSFGTGYFMYGKSTSTGMPMICGIILCIYPYFVENIWALVGIGILLILLPFYFRF
ncbi:MAG: amino acid transport protein [Candidatus Gracilibacteria bacterium]|nr:amino acid transport protein [Candidatus Gracilibacteria bacterium]